MLIISIILLVAGILVGGPLGFGAACLILIPIYIIKGIGGAVAKADKKRAYEDSHAICPACKEVVKVDANLCKHCGSRLDRQGKSDLDLDSKLETFYASKSKDDKHNS
jgi:hypothetical protein